MDTIKSEYPAESTHWYNKLGEPCHTYINKKGGVSNVTLREARKNGWYPSVTSIISLAAKPGLDVWKQDQLIMACLTLPKVEGESEQDYIKRIKEDARSQAKKAAEKGTEIHGYIEKGFRKEYKAFDSDDGIKYYLSVRDTIYRECGFQPWRPEKSFASELGYGGKCDLFNDLYLIDFKGTDKDINEVKLWDEHHMQLSSYDKGLPPSGRKCGICYVHRDTAESRLIWAKPEELEKGWKCFLALLGFYYAKTGLGRDIIH